MQIQRSAAILLSRQPIRPCGADPWVKQTRNAIQWVKANSLTLRSSVGMQTWELITTLASIEKLPLTLLVHSENEQEFFQTKRSILTQFDLDENNVTFRALLPHDGETYDKHKFMQERDRLIVLDTDVVIPISIRPDGVISKLVNESDHEGKPIINSWRIKYEARQESLGYEINTNDLTDEIISCTDRYLIHWTRATNEPWPTERTIDFYRDIVKSQRYPRNGLDTLRAITRQRNIVASTKHMPGDTPCVSFSALSPRELLPLIRWRSRYRQMSFEPYGIGIERETAIAYGLQPVHYYDSSDGTPDNIEKWRTQSNGVKSDWRREQEFRYQGDVNFSEIPKEKLVCFCRTHEEATQFQTETGITTIPFTD